MSIKRTRVKAERSEPEFMSELIKDTWRAGLKIDPHALDEALVRQPDLFYEISETLSLVLSRRDAAKEELKVVESEADEEIREEAERLEEKVTEAQVKAKIVKHSAVIKANTRLSKLNFEVGQLSAIKEAYMQRSYMLKELVSLYLANYYGDGTASANSKASRVVKDAQYDENRRALTRERERRR